MSDAKAELVPATDYVLDDGGTGLARDNGEATSLASIFGGMDVAEFHNFDGDAKAKWALVSAAVGPGDMDKNDVVGHPFLLRNYYLHQITMRGKTPGEIIQAIRTVLINTDGKMIAFVSEGVLKGLLTALRVNGRGPWPQGLPIKIKSVELKDGRRTYNLGPA